MDKAELSSGSDTARLVEAFLKEATELLSFGPSSPDDVAGTDQLKRFAMALKSQFRERLRDGAAACMLPSYNHTLPTGAEHGRFLALDVGGSTLRVALVELRGRPAEQDRGSGTLGRAEGEGAGDGPTASIVRMKSFVIDDAVKGLVGRDFFDWIAERIVETVESALQNDERQDPDAEIPIGLAWSFPIEQTSLRGGLLQGMGKGFHAADGLLGADLGEILDASCRKKGLKVSLSAIVNDSAAALLSQAYTHVDTRFALILGTGVNIAAYLPVSALGPGKFGAHPPPESWFSVARHVVVNTELGMFGHAILPLTRWDTQLLKGHPKPEFQPLEHLVSGFYLGEVVRLALTEAVEKAGVFGGRMPPSLEKPYSLGTDLISLVQGDTSPTLDQARAAFTARHPPAPPQSSTTSAATYTYTPLDLALVRDLASLVSRRSAAIVAASLVALWDLRREEGAAYREQITLRGRRSRQQQTPQQRVEDNVSSSTSSSIPSPPVTPSNEVGRASGRNDKEQAEPGQGADEEDGDVDGLHCDKDELAAIDAELARPRNVVAYNGSVIERYPAYRERLTMCLDALVSAVGGPEGAALDLVEARESSVIGAAVALACLDDTDKAVAATS